MHGFIGHAAIMPCGGVLQYKELMASTLYVLVGSANDGASDIEQGVLLAMVSLKYNGQPAGISLTLPGGPSLYYLSLLKMKSK